MNKKAMTILKTPSQKPLNQILAFLNLYQLTKNKFIPSINFWDRLNFRALWPDWPHPFLTMPTQKTFDQLLSFINLYQHKKQFLSGHASDTVNFRDP